MITLKTSLGKVGGKPNFKKTTNYLSTHDITNEHQLQKAAVKMLRAHNFLCFHTDVFNGISFIKDVKSKAIYKQHMIAMGATVGQPDLIIIGKGKVTFVEFKYGKSGKKSIAQVSQCNLLESMGYEVLEWRKESDCREWIVKQLNYKPLGIDNK